jgi:hypothetical protein
MSQRLSWMVSQGCFHTRQALPQARNLSSGGGYERPGSGRGGGAFLGGLPLMAVSGAAVCLGGVREGPLATGGSTQRRYATGAAVHIRGERACTRVLKEEGSGWLTLTILVLLGVTVPETTLSRGVKGCRGCEPHMGLSCKQRCVSAGGNRYFLSAPISAP